MNNFLNRLTAAAAGLTYPSACNAPLTVFTWSGNANSAADAIRQIAGTFRVCVLGVHAFFGELELDIQADRFGILEELFQNALKHVEVFRIGDGLETELYVVGQAVDGAWVGVKTKSIEP